MNGTYPQAASGTHADVSDCRNLTNYLTRALLDTICFRPDLRRILR